MKVKEANLLKLIVPALVCLLFVVSSFAQGGHPPDREVAWFAGQAYNVSAADWLPQKVSQTVQSKIFVVVYPIGWENLGLAAPQCNPCDHAGNGLTFDDFHDHVLDSIPGSAGWTPFKRVNVILPNYSFLAGLNDPMRDAAVSAAYASRIPATSATAVNDLLASIAPDGSPLAIRIDAGFFIHVAVNGGPQ
jgi:hypothetical protein